MKNIVSDKDVYPSPEVLRNAVGANYALYEELTDAVSGLGLAPEWRYYNDAKSWLCKVGNGKKTVFWLSVQDGGEVMVSFHFAPRAIAGALALDLGEGIRGELLRAEVKGRLVSIAPILTRQNFRDVLTLAEYKRDFK